MRTMDQVDIDAVNPASWSTILLGLSHCREFSSNLNSMVPGSSIMVMIANQKKRPAKKLTGKLQSMCHEVK